MLRGGEGRVDDPMDLGIVVLRSGKGGWKKTWLVSAKRAKTTLYSEMLGRAWPEAELRVNYLGRAS